MTNTNTNTSNNGINSNGSSGSKSVSAAAQTQVQLLACLEKLDFILANQLRLEQILVNQGIISASSGNTDAQNASVNA